jgi:hypothetical protein
MNDERKALAAPGAVLLHVHRYGGKYRCAERFTPRIRLVFPAEGQRLRSPD